MQTYERKQGKLDLDQMETVSLLWNNGIWDLDMWVETTAFRNMWCEFKKVWNQKMILRRKTAETLMTSVLSVILSSDVMKPRLCITLFVPVARSILSTFIRAGHECCCGAAETQDPVGSSLSLCWVLSSLSANTPTCEIVPSFCAWGVKWEAVLWLGSSECTSLSSDYSSRLVGK